MEISLTVCVFDYRDKPSKCKNSKVFKFRLNGFCIQLVVFKEILGKEDISEKTGVIPKDTIKLQNFVFNQDELFLIPKFSAINGNKFLQNFGETYYINGICCIAPRSEYAAAAMSIFRTIDGLKFIKLYPQKNVRFAKLSFNKFGK